jgi:hypothetical protein
MPWTAIKAVFDAKYNDLREALRVVMGKGGDEDVGTRIGAILSVLQKYGVSIPASLFNFSSSELRLQTSVAELEALMKEIKEDMEALDGARFIAFEGSNGMSMSVDRERWSRLLDSPRRFYSLGAAGENGSSGNSSEPAASSSHAALLH